MATSKHKGFDGNKRWGNSAVEGHGVNSPAMMEARAKHDALKKKTKFEGKREYKGKHGTQMVDHSQARSIGKHYFKKLFK